MALLKANTGIGTTNPTSALHVIGDGLVTGVVTATTFNGQINAGISTLGIATATNLTSQQLNVSGVSTFNGITTHTATVFGTQASFTGIITAPQFIGTASTASFATTAFTLNGVTEGNLSVGFARSSGVSTSVIGGIASVTQLSVSGVSTLTSVEATQIYVSGVTTSVGGFVGNLTGTATTATNLSDAANITTGTINSARLTGSYDIDISGNAATATYADNAGISTNVIGGVASVTQLFVSGVSTFIGGITGTISTATKLENARTFEITGDVVASPISFDGTGNVSLAATIQPNSVGLGTDTFGDYVKDISGTSQQIVVTGGTGEGSTPTLSLPTNLVVPQDLTVTRDLQVNRNLNVTGNVTIGGTSATIFATELTISDPDIVLGYRTDAFGNDVSNDNTANHGGIGLASTEGTPLVDLFIAGIETNPSTYKKIMWFKEGTFAGLGTDAWLINYAVGIGSTQFPTGTRLAAGSVQFTENDLAVVRNINASGIITAPQFIGTASTASFATTAFTLDGVAAGDLQVAYARNAGIATNVIGGIASVTQLTVSGVSTLSSVQASQIYVSGVTTSIGGFVGNLTGTASTASFATTAFSLNGTIEADLEVAYARNAGIATYAVTAGVSTYSGVSGFSTFSGYSNTSGISTSVIGGIASVTELTVSGVSTLGFVTASSVYSTGIVTALTFVGNLTGTATTASFATTAFTLDGVAEGDLSVGFARIAGIATYATNAGIATNLEGGVAGNVPYQSAPDTTTFVSNGTSGQILLFNGSIPVWSNVSAAAGAFGGIAVYDEGNLVGTAGSIASLNFVSPNLVVTATSGANGIATITMLDNLVGTALSISGISTFSDDVSVGSGITMYASTGIVSATAFYGSGINLTDLILGKIEGLQIQEEGSDIGVGYTFATLNFVGDYVNATGVGTVANITFTTPPYADVSGIATYADNAGVSTYSGVSGFSTFSGYSNVSGIATSVIGGIASVSSLNVSGITTLGDVTISSGIITSSNPGVTTVVYYGDGSNLQGVTAFYVATQVNTSEAVYPTLASGVGVNSVGISTTKLVFVESTASLGIGTTNPRANLHVVGDALITGVVTATTFSGNATSATYASTAGIATYATTAGIATNATTAGTATTATNINISATSSGDTTAYVVLVGDNVTGGQQPFIDNGSLTYNASTNTLTAGGFSGDGSALTSLNGSQITSGTIPGDRGVTSGSTSSSFVEYNGTTKTAGQFDGGTTNPTNSVRLNYDGYLYATRFYGDGSNLTALNADNISSGTINDAYLPATISSDITGNAATATNATNATNVTVTTSTTNSAFKVPFANTTANTTGNYGLLQDSTATFTYNPSTDTLVAGTFSGSGASLTSLSATNLNVSGISTLGITSTTNLTAQQLNVSGISTVGNLTVTPVGTGATVGGIGVTYYGDGSKLSGVISPESNGEFYTGVSSSIQLTPLSYETSIYTFPSTAGKQYVIESINVANVDTSVGVGTTVNIIASIEDSSGEQTYIAYNVPIVNGGLIELLKNPIVAGPSDVMKMWVTDGNYNGVNNATEVYMNYSEYTSTEYISEYASTVSIATTDSTAVYTSSTYPSTIEAIHFANRTDIGDYPVSVSITNGVTTTYLAKNLIIPRYAVVDILDRPKRVEVNGTVNIEVGQTSTIDIIIAGKQITS